MQTALKQYEKKLLDQNEWKLKSAQKRFNFNPNLVFSNFAHHFDKQLLKIEYVKKYTMLWITIDLSSPSNRELPCAHWVYWISYYAKQNAALR